MILGYANGKIKLCLEKIPDNAEMYVIDEWVETDDEYVLVGDEYLPIGDPRVATYKQNRVRTIRDSLLESEIDPVVSNPLRWADLSDAEKAQYSAYRKYLLDYTELLAWWEKEPMTMDEWKKENDNAVQEKEIS